MSGLGTRLLELFLAPAAEPRTAPARANAERVALLCTAGQARFLAGGLARVLAGRAGSVVAMTAVWGAPPIAPGGFPPLPAARRLASRLAARDLSAVASGRLARVTLPSDPADAAAAITRALAGADAGGAPAVLAIAGPRPATLDPTLATCDLLVVAVTPGAAPGLAAIASAGAPGGPPVLPCEVHVAPLARTLAAAGLLAPRALARSLEDWAPA